MKAHLTLYFALLLICSGAALAQTPDGMPPALETVCDMETGAAYGLCNAYCEAMDCESANAQASATACSKVRAKFENITGHDVPCAASCPCTTIPQFNAVLANVNNCVDLGSVVLVSPGGFELPVPPFFLESAGSSVGITDPVCGYVNLETATSIVLPITQEQAAVCVQILRDAAASNNVTCQL